VNQNVSFAATHASGQIPAGEEPARCSAETNCFACGPDNPHGLRIDYHVNADGSVRANWLPKSQWQSFNKVIHGGIVTTAMDEAMAKAIVATGQQGLTCELHVRLHDSVRPGANVTVRGWIVSRHRRLIKTEANICSPAGLELAHAWASFLILPGVKPQHPL
jgi:acyl-coenzyme A thioesterase PaaI-like protein